MDALTALHTRNSINLLQEPAPSQLQLENIIKAGLRACDHRALTPWHYLIIESNARHAFGELMVAAKQDMDGAELDSATRTKILGKPLRAPTIMVVVAKIQQHPSVPEMEQILSAGASAQMMMTAAHAQGVGAIWRSGSLMFSDYLKTGLGLADTDKIVGFIYLGAPKTAKQLPERDPAEFTSYWQG